MEEVHNHEGHHHSDHIGSLKEELMCHFPYAAFSLALGFVVLSLLHMVTAFQDKAVLVRSYHTLFHSFHYLHLIFAVTGTYITFFRFSQNQVMGVLIALLSPAFFCTLSDVALPAFAGNLLGVKMGVHICFTNPHDFLNIMPFMIVGILTGWMIRKHSESSLGFLSLVSHFIHILISSLAALFYMVSFGFWHWPAKMGLLFILLVFAVVVPCTISDIVVPLFFAQKKRFKA